MNILVKKGRSISKQESSGRQLSPRAIGASNSFLVANHHDHHKPVLSPMPPCGMFIRG
jgi:hypothetical protein